MIEEITQLRQKTLDLLKENHQVRQKMQAQQAEAEAIFLSFADDFLSVYDKSQGENKAYILSLLKKNEIALIPMSTASGNNDYTQIVERKTGTPKSAGTILEFIKEGFVWNQKVIRKAEVIVAA
jgi:molecular chaperone GrpE (heat shock protein)